MQSEPHKPIPAPTPVPDGDGAPPSAQRARFAQTVKAVLWGFIGIRKRRDLERDAVTIKPLHLVVIVIVLVALLVASLVTLVRLITH